MHGRIEPDRDLREDSRSNVFLSGTLYWAQTQAPVRVRNLSGTGAMLDGTGLPGEATQVELRRGSLSVRGEIVWHRGNLRGVRFGGPVTVADWVRKPGNADQRAIDRSIASIRNGGTSADTGSISASADRPETLESFATELQQICERLAGSPVMTVAFGEDLVRLDALAHRLMALSKDRFDHHLPRAYKG